MLRETNFTFMYAPRYHPAMKNVGLVRRELGVKTIFNVLGPLTNPAAAGVQIVGVAHAELVEPLAKVLQDLGVRRGQSSMARTGSMKWQAGRSHHGVLLRSGRRAAMGP